MRCRRAGMLAPVVHGRRGRTVEGAGRVECGHVGWVWCHGVYKEDAGPPVARGTTGRQNKRSKEETGPFSCISASRVSESGPSQVDSNTRRTTHPRSRRRCKGGDRAPERPLRDGLGHGEHSERAPVRVRDSETQELAVPKSAAKFHEVRPRQGQRPRHPRFVYQCISVSKSSPLKIRTPTQGPTLGTPQRRVQLEPAFARQFQRWRSGYGSPPLRMTMTMLRKNCVEHARDHAIPCELDFESTEF
jgi:hypothetical protein